MMDFEKLFQMQKGLDSHIEEKHGLQDEDLLSKKILALFVELGELANETRCFKFWSVKPASERAVILEEFVDGIHFILSLGIECGFDQKPFDLEVSGSALSVTEQFLCVYERINIFQKNRGFDAYKGLLESYLQLAAIMKFNSSEIEIAYFAKNEVNYQRQQSNY